jgi:hypothetical protein
MPVNKQLAKSLKKQYGATKGEQIYYAMENAQKHPFKKGMRTAMRKGHVLKKFPRGKK